MKNVLYTVCFIALYCTNSYSQSLDSANEKRGRFNKEKLFAGGGMNLSLFNSRTVLGVNPYFGYSINRWLDVALSMNVNYISQRNYFIDDDKVRQIVLAPGALSRLYPVKFLFAELQFERNFIMQKYIPAPGSVYSEEKIDYNANTLLVGIGYASDREYDDDEFYFISLSFDLLRNEGSPYTNNLNHVLPIIKAGYNLKLFPVRHKRKR